MKTAQIAAQLVEWLRDYVYGAGSRGVVFGLSGGLDSAVVAGLAVRAFGADALGIIMPCYSDPTDAEHARLCAEALGLSVITVNLNQSFDTLCQTLSVTEDTPSLAVANLKPRLRMLTLNYYAAARQALVLGGTNRSEWVTGYFTKHGDTGVDLMPIGRLVKRQVRELAAYLGVPQVIIDKAPTAGLWPGQTDEEEMGITYDQLDDYILTGKADAKVQEIVDNLQRRSEHKRRLPPMPDFIYN
jgi:NAD+ synthase